MPAATLEYEILPKVTKPARYTGGEMGQIKKDWAKTRFKFGIGYPDLYEVGMSSRGVQIIYFLLNRLSNVLCERFFSPAQDMEKILIEMGMKPTGTVSRLLDDICTQLAASGRPLIIDEFDFALRSDSMVELVRDIYEGSQAAMILAGEELLPRKLARWERFHSRVLTWIPASAVSLADAQALAPIYCATPCADDFLKMLVDAAGGSVRRVCVNLARADDLAKSEGWRKIDRKTWGELPVYTGQAPIRTLPEGCRP